MKITFRYLLCCASLVLCFGATAAHSDSPTINLCNKESGGGIPFRWSGRVLSECGEVLQSASLSFSASSAEAPDFTQYCSPHGNTLFSDAQGVLNLGDKSYKIGGLCWSKRESYGKILLIDRTGHVRPFTFKWSEELDFQVNLIIWIGKRIVVLESVCPETLDLNQ